MLSSGEDEDKVVGDDDNGVEYLGKLDDAGLKIRTGSGLKAADDDNGVEYLGKLDTSSLKVETESRLKVGGLDEVVSSLAERYGNLSNSGETDQSSVDSDSSIGSRNSSEDSLVSESELINEDYDSDESSSSDDTFHVSSNKLVKSTRKNLGKESGTVQGKEDESDDGCNGKDQRSSPCQTADDHQSDGEISMVNVKEKFLNVRKNKRRNAEKERDDVIDKTKKWKSARRNPKGDEIQQDQDECVGLNSVSKSKSQKTGLGKCSSPLPFESAFPTAGKMNGQQQSKEKVKLGSRKSCSERNLDFIKILVDSLNTTKENQYSIDEDALPLKFRFEDLVVPPPEKSEWEEHIDSLFKELELGLRESETDCSNNVSNMEHDDDDVKTTEEVVESIAAACSRGNHHKIVDEQIGIICKYCDTLITDIKDVLPDFHTPARNRRSKMCYYDETPSDLFGEVQFQGSASTTCRTTSCTKGTVWDLIPGVEIGLKPHQREGIEFIWRNIAGDIILEKLKQTVADDARGCIISHAPGTGKTRLTIVFLQTYMKLYPSCSPVIMAPRGMLLNWEAEFKKWNFNVAFHNLNKNELSGKENEATRVLAQANCGTLNERCIRLLKLHSWSRGGSILGISYTLFEKLAGEKGGGEQVHEKMREVLLERPGLLVLDEGHTPRNNKSKLWNVLTKVTTLLRIILSGTPFQNNLQELFNTLCVVNPKLANQDSRWSRIKNSNNRHDAMKLRAMVDPFVHVQDSSILEESLPGLRHTLVFLRPTECQETLLKIASQERQILRRIMMVSLISVHPSITAVMKRYPNHHSMLQELKSDVNAGVKTMFLMKLINFADALGERVLVFSQFLDSLALIKEQLESNFSWKEGREVLYMDGTLEDKKRQDSISSFNDDTSEAKVLLASVKACCEGINLIGASRVVLLDTVWNPSVEKQAICRAYRLGQKKIVHVYRLFTSGIEERQYAQQFRKEQMSHWIFSLGEKQAFLKKVTEDKVLDSILNLRDFNRIFVKVISQPNESDLIKTFDLEK